MITSNHDQLDTWVSVLTLATSAWGIGAAIRAWTNRGWMEADRLQKDAITNSVAALKASDHIQFQRIDELKMAIADCVTREMKDQLQRELTDKMDRSHLLLSQQITEGFAQMNARIDRLSDRTTK